MNISKSFRDQKGRFRLTRAKVRYFFAKLHFVMKNYRKAKLLFKMPIIQSISFIIHMTKFLAVYKDGRVIRSHNFWKLYTLGAKEFDFHVSDTIIRHAEIGACEEIFSGEYGWLPVKNKIVVDIGSSIGDSPIYFALRGAKTVIAIESDSIRFKYLEENVKNSKFSNLIYLLNIRLVDDRELPFLLNPEVEMSLKQILQMFDIQKGAVMKIDCEGCEYDAILKADPVTLSKFSHIIGEYHYDYPDLKNKLEACGFKTRFRKPTFFYDPTKSNPNCMIGNFMAWI